MPSRDPDAFKTPKDMVVSYEADRIAKAKDAVIAALRKHGQLARAARDAGVSPSTVYKWRQTDEIFAEDFREARETAVTEAEDTVFQLAQAAESESVRLNAAKFLLQHHKPETYNTKHVEHDHKLEWKSNIPQPAKPLPAHEDNVIDVSAKPVEEE